MRPRTLVIATSLLSHMLAAKPALADVTDQYGRTWVQSGCSYTVNVADDGTHTGTPFQATITECDPNRVLIIANGMAPAGWGLGQ